MRQPRLILVLTFILLSQCISAQSQPQKKYDFKYQIANSFQYTLFSFAENSVIDNRIFQMNFFKPASIGLNLSFGVKRKKLFYNVDWAIGTGRFNERLSSGGFLRIENFYTKINPSVGYFFESTKTKIKGSFTLCAGISAIHADFRRISSVETTVGDIFVFDSKSFTSLGWTGGFISVYYINKKLAIRIPIKYEYYPSAELITINTGIGWVLRL